MAGPLTASIYSTSEFMGHPKEFHCGSLMIFTLQIKTPMALNYKSEHKSLKEEFDIFRNMLHEKDSQLHSRTLDNIIPFICHWL